MASTNISHEVSVQEGYGRWAELYDHEENALISVEEQLTTPLLAGIPTKRVLDLGAGTGRYAIRLAAQGAQVTALDQSQAMIAVARQAAAQAGVHIRFVQHGLEYELPIEPGSFDLVLAALVLCHVDNLALVAHEAYRALRPGGNFMVTDFHPAAIAAGWRTQFTDTDVTYLLPTARHTRDQYLTALANAGFIIQSAQEALVRDIPEDTISADLLEKDGEKPFCLVILASKPADG